VFYFHRNDALSQGGGIINGLEIIDQAEQGETVFGLTVRQQKEEP